MRELAMEKPDTKKLLTVEDFADAISITPAAVRKWIYQGRLTPVKLGRAVRLRRSDLDRIVANGLTPV
jgi:excisionase family DNA binding protein